MSKNFRDIKSDCSMLSEVQHIQQQYGHGIMNPDKFYSRSMWDHVTWFHMLSIALVRCVYNISNLIMSVSNRIIKLVITIKYLNMCWCVLKKLLANAVSLKHDKLTSRQQVKWWMQPASCLTDPNVQSFCVHQGELAVTGSPKKLLSVWAKLTPDFIISPGL